MKELVYTLIFILLLIIVLLIYLVIIRGNLIQKYYKGYTRVSHKDAMKKIHVKVSEDDLRRAYYAQLADESVGEEDSNFCREQELCHKYCNDEVCLDYRDKKINYDYCVDCEKNGLCWNELNGDCEKCKDGEKSCNEKYGCGDKPIMNPGRNFCKRCWKTE